MKRLFLNKAASSAFYSLLKITIHFYSKEKYHKNDIIFTHNNQLTPYL